MVVDRRRGDGNGAFGKRCDVDSVVTCGNVTASSGNTALVPNGNIVISGSGTNCAVTVTPAPNQGGDAMITLTVTDSANATASDAFLLTVGAPADAIFADGFE